MPEKFQTTAIPYLCVHDAKEAIDFYNKAFGATEIACLPDAAGRISHAELEIGGARIMLSDEYPEIDVLSPKSIGGSAVMIVLEVPDVDALFAKAVAAGAFADRSPQDGFDGRIRTAKLVDAYGHRWMLLTHKTEATD